MDPSGRNLTLPNVLTVLRVIITPGFITAFLSDQVAVAWWLFASAAVTDGLDGFLARVLNQRSRLGAVLDPLADKVLVVAAFLCLGHKGWLPEWLVITVISRDVVIVGGMALLEIWGVSMLDHISPSPLSKVNTTGQLALVFLLLAQQTFGFAWPGAVQTLIVAVGALTVTTGIHYMVVGLSLFPSGDQDGPRRPGQK